MSNVQATPPHLFVYGTLRSDSGHEMHRMLADNARFVGRAAYNGRLYLVGDYSGAVPSSDARHAVRGEVYRMLDPDVLLARLDEYEGYDPASPETALYRRVLADTRLDSGETIPAWIYIYNQSVTGFSEIASGDFLDVLRPRT